MITRTNLINVLTQLSAKDVKRIKNTDKVYIVLYLSSYGHVTFRLTNDFIRYQYVSNSGNCILEVMDILNLLEVTEQVKTLTKF